MAVLFLFLSRDGVTWGWVRDPQIHPLKSKPKKKKKEKKKGRQKLSGGMCSSLSTDLSFMGHSNLKAIQAHTNKEREVVHLFLLSSHDVAYSRATLSCYIFLSSFLCRLARLTHSYSMDPYMVGQVSPSTMAQIRI